MGWKSNRDMIVLGKKYLWDRIGSDEKEKEWDEIGIGMGWERNMDGRVIGMG